MKFLLRFAPSLLLLASVLILAHRAQADVSAKTVVRSEEARSLGAPLSCSQADPVPAEAHVGFANYFK